MLPTAPGMVKGNTCVFVLAFVKNPNDRRAGFFDGWAEASLSIADRALSGSVVATPFVPSDVPSGGSMSAVTSWVSLP